MLLREDKLLVRGLFTLLADLLSRRFMAFVCPVRLRRAVMKALPVMPTGSPEPGYWTAWLKNRCHDMGCFEGGHPHRTPPGRYTARPSPTTKSKREWKRINDPEGLMRTIYDLYSCNCHSGHRAS
jgi:hypothetical protein